MFVRVSAPLTISDLDDAVARKLHAQASSHGRSVEAEAREILVCAILAIGDTPPPAAKPSDRQPFLDLAGSVDGSPDLSRKRGFEA